MSNYQRNTSLVICIFAVLVIGAVGIGLISYYGTGTMNWTATTDFSFEAETGATNETVTLDVDLAAGGVSVTFVDNESLLYDITIEVDNTTLSNDGAPTVTFTSNTIRLDYTGAGVNITLGSGVNYTIDVNAVSGGISAIFGPGAHIGDVALEATSGGIFFRITSDAVIMGNATIDLSVSSGGISMNVDVPTGIEASVRATATTGGVDLDAVGWAIMGTNYYETLNYAIGSQTLDIVATATSGGISGDLT